MGSLSLGLAGDLRNETLAWMPGPVDVRVVEAGVAHELGEIAGISGHTRDNDTDMLVNFEHFLLMHGQIVWALLQTNQYLFADKIFWLSRAHFSAVKRILTMWESDLRPTEVDPYLTASLA